MPTYRWRSTTNPSGAFQQLMAKIVSGIRGVEVFLDDILVHSKTLEEHIRILHMLFRQLREYGFHLRVEKCRFYQDEQTSTTTALQTFQTNGRCYDLWPMTCYKHRRNPSTAYRSNRQILRSHIDQLRSATEEAAPDTEPLSIFFEDFWLDSFEHQWSELPINRQYPREQLKISLIRIMSQLPYMFPKKQCQAMKNSSPY